MTEFERTNFFEGRLLTAEDLRREQDYANAKRWLHNRLAHGSGVVEGLELDAGSTASPGVTVRPGAALDPRGREIVVLAPTEIKLPGLAGEWWSVGIVYEEEVTEEQTLREGFRLLAQTDELPEEAVALGSVRVQDGVFEVDAAPRRVSTPSSLEERLEALELRFVELE